MQALQQSDGDGAFVSDLTTGLPAIINVKVGTV